MKKLFSMCDFGSVFHSSSIEKDEFEKIIEDAVKKERPNNFIKQINYDESGIIVILNDAQEIEIEIDWNEIILS